MLAVAVGGLVQIHEVHVDLFIGNLAVVLGGKVAVGLLQVGKAVDPHFAGAEGVAPGDDARAVLVIVGLAHHVGDLGVGLGGNFVDDFAGQIAGGAARLRMPRKVIAGYWQDEDVQKRLGDWMRAAVGVAVSRELKVMRFGDNMREVAVTEGDKVEVQAKLGWQVNTWPVGQLVDTMNAVTDAEIDALMDEYRAAYDFASEDTDFIETVRYQAREEIAMKKMLDAEGCKAFSNTFQDLYGMRQLPGIASQHLMAQGYGYGGEGDWKVAAMTAIIKAMAEGKTGGTAFMEDYTYNLVPGAMYSLGAHMLEVCPSVAAARPRVEVHPLGIGDREPPARLVFEGHEGDAIVVSLIDMGGRLRLICQDIHCVKPILPMPNLPVARVMWQAMPDLTTGLECWITAGGAHHTTLTYDVTADQMKDWANMMGIEFVHITKDTTVESLEQQLFLNDLAWKLKG